MLVIKEYGNMLPEPEDFDKYFHEMYRIHPETQRKRQEWKKLKKKAPKKRSKQKKKLETHGDNDYLAPPEMELPGNASSFAVFASIRLAGDNDYLAPPEMELPGNASSFAVFASIRLAVLDRWMRQANQDYLQSSCSYPIIDGCDKQIRIIYKAAVAIP
ncbi:hypothetical protein QE152_g29182 [Popillia japonica]|uniref:Uncharacterized protein n=1 Tax=Popillia japonica TaxID=7064 RepID=A0AAW1JJT1_POPJA